MSSYPQGTPSTNISGTYTNTGDFSSDAMVAGIIDNYSPVNKNTLRRTIGKELSQIANFVNTTYLGRSTLPVKDIYCENIHNTGSIDTIHMDNDDGGYLDIDDTLQIAKGDGIYSGEYKSNSAKISWGIGGYSYTAGSTEMDGSNFKAIDIYDGSQTNYGAYQMDGTYGYWGKEGLKVKQKGISFYDIQTSSGYIASANLTPTKTRIEVMKGASGGAITLTLQNGSMAEGTVIIISRVYNPGTDDAGNIVITDGINDSATLTDTLMNSTMWIKTSSTVGAKWSKIA